jgi:Tol biopolymer transport system component
MKNYLATNRKWYWLTIVIALIGVGCGREPEPAARPEVAATIVVTRATPIPAELATATPSTTAEPSPIPPPTATVTFEPTPSSTPLILPTLPPPPGLVYSTNSGLWKVNEDGEAQQLFDDPYAVLSPDGNRVLYREAQDIWLSDLVTEEARNLTQTPADIECCPQWWAARPDSILFLVSPENQPSYQYRLGFLATFNLDNGSYQILENESWLTSGSFAPSFDGQAILYDADGPRVYRWGIGAENVETSSWQVEPPQESLYLYTPTWSPDGNSIAWMAVLGNVEAEYGPLIIRWGLLVVNLETKVARAVHTFLAHNSDVFPLEPSWSADGRWIAIGGSISQRSDGSFWTGSELWIVAADGSGEKIGLDIEIDEYIETWSIAWSPDGRWLAFTPEPNEESAVWLAEVGTWQIYRIPLPGNEGVTLRDWLAVTP